MNWDHPNPVFMDFETQSAADIEEVGGRLYAEHKSTRLFITVLCHSNVYHVWIPDYIFYDSSKVNPDRLWPYQLTPRCPVKLYRGNDLPRPMVELCQSAPMVAHNAYGFDKFIWDRFIGIDCEWLDSLPLARANGRTGSLDRLGKQLLGQGKDRAKKLLPKLTTAYKSDSNVNAFIYPLLLHGDVTSFITYAIADVEILRRIWEQDFFDSFVESDVIAIHNSINDRGIQVDIPLLKTIERLSIYSVEQATREIAELTGGKLHANNIRSVKQVHEWLESYGVRITVTDQSGKDKLSLRKDVVQRYIDSPYLIEDNLTAVTEIPPVVIEVLKLRMKALRITDAKVTRAQERVSPDGRIRDTHTYHVAGTGRFGSTGVQFHNLPHPHPDIKPKLEEIIQTLGTNKQDGLWTNKDIAVIFNRIKELIPKPKNPKDIPATIDDVNSSLLRLALMASEGNILAIVDYSQIEARMAAFLADEKKLLEVFADHTRDSYREFASKVFGIPVHGITDVQRQVGKVSLLGLQYGMGPDKWRVFAASNKVDLQAVGVTAESVIELYRNTYTKICGFRPSPRDNFRTGGIWQQLDKAVKRVVIDKTVEVVAKSTFHMNGRDMVCILPSGRPMIYPEVRIEDIIPPYVYTLGLPPNPKATVVYTSNRGPKSLYGGLLFENIVQAASRDIMATALIKLDNRGFNPVLHVHDEPVSEIPDDFNSIKRLHEKMRIMVDLPGWAEGFPVECEGFLSPRFTKEPFKAYKKVKSYQLEKVG